MPPDNSRNPQSSANSRGSMPPQTRTRQDSVPESVEKKIT